MLNIYFLISYLQPLICACFRICLSIAQTCEQIYIILAYEQHYFLWHTPAPPLGVLRCMGRSSTFLSLRFGVCVGLAALVGVLSGVGGKPLL